MHTQRKIRQPHHKGISSTTAASANIGLNSAKMYQMHFSYY